ncbi:MAG: hypothetical protein LBG83_06705 [Oscillospiraceae bacterium]|jgi:hypothetical protein|nr:hypothetical protein [Oscillospiraceae bacterium]
MKIKKVKRIPMERKSVQDLGEFFGSSLQNLAAEDTGASFDYFLDRGDVEYRYIFNKNIIEEIKNKLSVEETQISLGNRANKMWLSLIVLAYEQGHDPKEPYKIKGKFRYADILRLWGQDEGGKTYADIRYLFMSLASAKFTIKQKNKKADTTKIYSLIDYASVTKKMDEDGQTEFEFELNEKTLGLTADWIRFGKISKSKQLEGYLNLPVSDISEQETDSNYLNFRRRLRLFPGGHVGGYFILNDWMRLTDAKLTRRAYCYEVLTQCLQKAKMVGELKNYTATLVLDKNWHEKWTVHIEK